MLPAEQTERRHWLQIFDRLVDDGKHGMVDKLLADSKQALAFADRDGRALLTQALQDQAPCRSCGFLPTPQVPARR